MSLLSSIVGGNGLNIGTAVAKLTLDSSEYSANLNKSLIEAEGFGVKFQSTLSSISGSLNKIGSSMTKTFTIPISTALGAATKKYSDFSGTLKEAGTIMNATTEEMKMLSDEAYRSASKSVFSTSDAAQAYKYMAMAGWDASEATSALSAVMSLAAISGEGLGIVSDIVTDDLTAFGLEAKDASHFANVLAEVSMDANTNVGLMGEAMKYAGPLAGTLGYSIEDVSVAMGLMANQSIKGSTAGTTLRQALTSMINPTKEATGVMVKLGLATQETNVVYNNEKISKAQANMEKTTNNLEKAQSTYNDAVAKYGENSSQAQKALINVENATIDLNQAQEQLNKQLQGSIEDGEVYNELMFDSTGKAKPFREVLVQLRGAFANLSEEEQASAAATLFGQRAMSGMLAIMNTSNEEFDEFIGKLDESRDAEEVAYNMLDSLRGSFEKFKSTLDVFLTRLGEAFAPVVEKVLGYLSEWLNRLNSLSDGELRHVTTIALIVAAIGPLLIVLGKLVSGINNVVGIFLSFGKSAATVMTSTSAVTASFGNLAGAALKLAATAALILAVAEAIKMLVNSAIELYNAGPGAIATFAGLAAAGVLLTGAIAAIGSACTATAAGLLSLGAAVLMVSSGVALITAAISLVVKAFADLVEAFTPLADKLPIVSEYGFLAAGAITALGAACSIAMVPIGLMEVALGLFNITAGLSIPIITGLAASIELLSVALRTLNATMLQCARTFEQTWDIISRTISKAVKDILGWIEELIFGIIDLFKRLKYELIGDPIVLDLVEGVKDAFWGMVEKVIEFIKTLVEKIIEFFKQLFEDIKNWLEKIVKKVESFISDIVKSITNFFLDLLKTISDKIKEIFDSIVSFFAEILQHIIDDLSNILKTITDWFTDLPNKMYNWGRDILFKLWDGLTSVWDGVKRWAEEKFGWLNDIVAKISSAASFINGTIGGIFNGSHAGGLDYVPFDGYVAQLHKGERVLTKQENKEYSNGANNGNSGDTFNFYNTKPDPREYARQMKQAKKELLFN